MPEPPFLNIEDKQDSLAQVEATAGLPTEFKYTAAEWNLMRDKINELKGLLDNAGISTPQSLTGTTIVLTPQDNQYNHETPLPAGPYILTGTGIGYGADVVVNASIEPSFNHATLNVTESETSADFEPDVDMQAFFIINANGVRYYWVKY